MAHRTGCGSWRDTMEKPDGNDQELQDSLLLPSWHTTERWRAPRAGSSDITSGITGVLTGGGLKKRDGPEGGNKTVRKIKVCSGHRYITRLSSPHFSPQECACSLRSWLWKHSLISLTSQNFCHTSGGWKNIWLGLMSGVIFILKVDEHSKPLS